tara:strand:+ start:487 stop:684 length:198 start_codon:yes stop_codon:yes gene_type:complete
MKNVHQSLGFIKVTNEYNKLTDIQKIQLELLNNEKTIIGYLKIKTNYKYWSTQRVTEEINNLKNK